MGQRHLDRCLDCDLLLPAEWGEPVCLLCKNAAVIGHAAVVTRLTRRVVKRNRKVYSTKELQQQALVITQSVCGC